MTKFNIDSKYKSMSKGILMIAAGLLVAFFPGVINKLFYIIGVLIAAFGVITLVLKLLSGAGNIFGSIICIIVGGAVTFLPSLVTTGIPLIAGVVLGVSGLERVFTAAETHRTGGKWQIHALVGTVLLIIACVFIFHPFSVSNILRIVLGLVIMVIGSANMFTDMRIAKKSKDSDIIDVDFHEV